MSRSSGERWALRRGEWWVVAPKGVGYPLPAEIALGLGTKKAPVITMNSYQEARNFSFLIKATLGVATEVRRLP